MNRHETENYLERIGSADLYQIAGVFRQWKWRNIVCHRRWNTKGRESTCHHAFDLEHTGTSVLLFSPISGCFLLSLSTPHSLAHPGWFTKICFILLSSLSIILDLLASCLWQDLTLLSAQSLEHAQHLHHPGWLPSATGSSGASSEWWGDKAPLGCHEGLGVVSWEGAASFASGLPATLAFI